MKLSTLLVLALGFPLTAHARKGPPRSEADAVERRVADLATATGLSPDQATTVFAQLLDPPLAPAFLQVVDERRPDGTRNVFARMQVDYDLECRLVDDSGDCSTERGREQDLLFVQVAPDGRIHRTARTTPFTVLPDSGRQIERPVSLRLFAPRPGDPAIALVEGTDVSPPQTETGGHVEPATFTYKLALWNGRTRLEHELALAAPGGFFAYTDERLATLVLAPDAHQITVRELSCEDGCRCDMPRDLARMRTQLDRLARTKTCHATERTLPLPPDLRLIDDDLDALIPRASRAEALAARPSALARAFTNASGPPGLSLPEATALIDRFTTFGVSPAFAMAATHRGPDDARYLSVLVATSTQTECIYGPRHRSLYDAVRACADRTSSTHQILQARLAADGSIANASLRSASLGPPIALHVLGLGLVGVEAAHVTTNVVGHHFYLHDVTFDREGSYVGLVQLGRLGDAPNERDKADRYLGELTVTTGPDGFVRLSQRRIPCSRACPCPVMPTDPAHERELVLQRTTHEDPRCRPAESAVTPRR